MWWYFQFKCIEFFLLWFYNASTWISISECYDIWYARYINLNTIEKWKILNLFQNMKLIEKNIWNLCKGNLVNL